jgi:hypothetical protein
MPEVSTIGAGVRLVYDATTGEAGMQVRLTNRTGGTSVKGTLLECSGTYNRAVATAAADAPDVVHVCAESGIADGSEVWCWCVGSVCQVLLQNSTAATRDYWVRTSTSAAGRADATNSAPPGGTITALEGHFDEVGHALESKTAGTDVLALISFHPN